LLLARIYEKCLLLARIHGNRLLIPLTRKARSVPSRSPRIRIIIECVLADRCLAMDYLVFQASCHTAPSLRLFVPNSLLVYHRSFFSKVFARDSVFSDWPLANRSHCYLFKGVRPERLPDKVPVNPGASLPSRVFLF
jgi:hypothetical protein